MYHGKIGAFTSISLTFYIRQLLNKTSVRVSSFQAQLRKFPSWLLEILIAIIIIIIIIIILLSLSSLVVVVVI